jgi:hypothetical protein
LTAVSALSWHPKLIAAVLAASMAFPPLGSPPAGAAGTAGAAGGVRVGAYRGLAAWVDIYDDDGWANPEVAVAAMAGLGVRTLFLETCNYKCKRELFKPDILSRWVDAAHASRMRIVAWYLPGFDDLHRDRKRSLAAIRFRSATGQSFDSFALDIEARLVSPVARRNRRIVELSQQIRKAAGARYPLGAITPPWFYDWGGPFPYAELDRWYDVFVPMIYFGGMSSGAAAARRAARLNIEQIRNGTGDPTTRVHAIGGIADELNGAEVGAFVRAAQRRGAIGVSLYDFFTSGPEDWTSLAAFRS